MASAVTATTTATITTSYNRPPLPPIPNKTLSRGSRRPAASTSTPNLNSAYLQARPTSTTPRAVSRKASLAALTPSSLATIPDVAENYVLSSVVNQYPTHNMAPTTPGRLHAGAGDDLAVGDIVDVPGGMNGFVRFVGSVDGKKGTFVGVELDQDFASKGKNNGDVDGISYFTTSIPGAGIFVPVTKVLKRDGPSRPASRAFPRTPTAGLKAANQNSTNFTPPIPALPKFSASVGPGSRAPSPQGKSSRASLPRPESPARRQAMTPGPRPSMGPSMAPARTPSKMGSPTNRFAQSVRGAMGDPSKGLGVKPNFGQRSVSAMGFDEDIPSIGLPRTKTTGSVSSLGNRPRPSSRMNGSNDQEVERLRNELAESNRQLKDQSTTLAEMEASLNELQGLMESSDFTQERRSSIDDKDSGQLRSLIREKNQKIAMLTAEFDAHRADFRSTIDTLEMASTETERVYEKRMEELMAEIRDLESRNLDVDSVASQLKQLEELVQELEEGLEDARRGEAEARGEVEFLRGEVERTRAELRRERDKAVGSPTSFGGRSPKELEQKDDEIRGLKAIIHSLSRDSDERPSHGRPGSMGRPMSMQRHGSMGPMGRPASVSMGRPGSMSRPPSLISEDVVAHKIARDNLERQVAELQSIMSQKDAKMEEMEKQLGAQNGGNNENPPRTSVDSGPRASVRDSRDTVVVPGAEARSPEIKRAGNTLAPTPESDANSNATGDSALWCEICETGGHDILTCSNMFGPEGSKANAEDDSNDGVQAPREGEDGHVAPLAPAKPPKSASGTPAAKATPNPMDFGPVAGKTSGVLNPEKWCALCERDGHDSVDCPFEDDL